MNRNIARAVPPLIDIVVFCALFRAGHSLLVSHMTAFAVATLLNYFLNLQPRVHEAKRDLDWKLYLGLLAVALMALFLRGGLLGLLIQRWHWPAPPASGLAVGLGWIVTAAGWSHTLALQGADARRRALAIGLTVYAFALRIVYMGPTELLPEEAYYWNYSRHLDIGYLDHPPMVAWLTGLGTALFGQSEFGVRIGAIACGAVTSWFAYRLALRLFDEATALGTLVLVQILPFFFLSGLLLTPDAPLTAAWAASLCFLESALVGGRAGAWWRSGCALGAGLISKYSIGLLAPVTVAFMLWDAPARQWWRRYQPYAAVVIALAIFSPVILWNAEHAWASFAFQTSRRLAEAPRFALHKLIASTLVLITPIGALAIFLALIRRRSASQSATRPWRLIRLSVLVPLGVFAVFSLRHEVKLDWTGAMWTAALPAMAVGMTSAEVPAGRVAAWLRGAWPPTLVILVLIYGAGLHYLVLGLPGAGYGKHIELVPVGWREFARQVSRTAEAVRTESGNDPLIVGMDRYAIASELAFYGPQSSSSDHNLSSVHLFDGVGLMYERWTPAETQEGRTVLLIAWDAGDLEGAHIESHAERLGPIVTDSLTHDGHVIREFYHRVAYNYRSNQQPRTP